MLVSVIVPVYNVEVYLEECLESILSQTYKKLEIILVDDGSTDDSGKICDEYAKKYKNIIVIHKENEGLGIARNTGLAHMTGDYVTFVDSDDYLEPMCIQNLLEGILQNNVDMSKGASYKVADNGHILAVGKYKKEIFKGSEARKSLLPRIIGSRPDEKDSIGMSVWGALFSCKLIQRYQLAFMSEREWIEEDLVFYVDYLQVADGACLIDKTVYNYRRNMNSLTTSYKEDRFEKNKQFFLKMQDKLIKLGYDDMTILRLKRNFFIAIRGTIWQENKKNAGKSFRMCLERIKEICSDPIVIQTIQSYPVKKLGIQQRIFLSLIMRRASISLYFCSVVMN